MKTPFKILSLLLFTVLLFNCSKDDLENHSHSSHSHSSKDEISFKQFKNETGINKFDFYKKANVSTSTDFQARTIESEFITDTIGIKKYVNPIDNKTTYSFKIYPISESLSPNQYYNLVYEKIGTEWNEIIFFNTNKANPTDGRELESSEMVYNRISGREGFTEIITYSVHCNGSCSGVCDGFACTTGECIRTTITYVYTGIEDTGNDSNGNPPGSGNPPNSGGGDSNGIYIPNPYDGDADPNNVVFMLAGQLTSFTNTLDPNLQSLISNYNFVYPYILVFCINNEESVGPRNKQKITTALNHFYNFQLNTNFNNLSNVNIDRFKFWAFYTFLNYNPLDVNNTKIENIKSFVQSTDYDTANSIVDYLYENKDSQEAIDYIDYGVKILNSNPDASPFLGADCRSFEFAKPPGASQRGCAVTDFNHTFYTAGVFPNGSPYYGEIDSTVPIAYFTMPSYMTNGRAANLTAIAVTSAIKATDLYYYENPNISAIALGQYFSNRLNHFLSAVGGSVRTSNPPFNIPSPAPYITSIIGLSNPYDCE